MRSKKRLAAQVLKTSLKKVRFAEDALEDIKKAITKSDIRGLVAVKKITKARTNEQSRSGARKIAEQKKKGRRQGQGSKKGKKNSKVTKKEKWMVKIRAQRDFIKELRTKKLLSPTNYRNIYQKSKGGYFRNKRHIKLYLTEHQMFEKNNGDNN